MYWFCHISIWICHRYTRFPHPETSSLLPCHTIPLGHPSAPAPSIQYCALNLDWRLISYIILYMLQCHSPKSSHPLPSPQSPKDCSIHQCLFCCLVYRVIVTIFLNSVYAAAAKSLQLCLTLCNPIDGSPPGFPSLGFSRQEHWSGLPFPSPMHEREKWKWSCLVVSDS